MRPPFASDLVEVFVTDRASRPPMNEAAFLDFYARTAGPLAGYLRRLTGNRAMADDLAQEAYLRFLSARVPDQDDYRRHYLFRIATNLARDHFRLQQREAAPRDERAVAAVDPSPDADIWAVVGRLSTRDRELLLLAYVEGLTHKEIAHVTGLMRASVKPLLFRARRRFAHALRAAGLAAPEASEATS